MKSLPEATKGPLVPDWVSDYAATIQAIANATVAYTAVPPAGSSAFLFGGGKNAVLVLNLGPLAQMKSQNLFTGTIALGPLTPTGTAGSMKIVNGVVVPNG